MREVRSVLRQDSNKSRDVPALMEVAAKPISVVERWPSGALDASAPHTLTYLDFVAFGAFLHG